MKNIFEFLRAPVVENIDVDGDERFLIHDKMLARKRMLREVFIDFHHIFNRLDERFLSAGGIRVELGAGVAPIRDSYPDVLATDIVPSQKLDRVINAENMDFGDGSVRVIFGQNCFHHFPHPDHFFHELERVVPSGGGAILLDPYYGPLASFLFKRLFKTEGYNKDYPSWDTPVSGPMNGANQALSYIVFVRDKHEFEQQFPALKIVHTELCANYLKYLVSGGLNFRQLCPDWASRIISLVQCILSPLNRWLALHHVIVIRKVVI